MLDSMLSDATTVVLDDFRFALDVIEDRSHLGLDPAYASKLRALIVKRIARTEEALKSRPSAVAKIQAGVERA